MRPVTVMTIFGTRPEAIKMAPLALELSRRPQIDALCCVTAQHRQMLDSVLDIFRLVPDFDLNIMEPRQTLSTITSKCLLGMEEVLEQARPDLVLVHGDTSTTFAGALAAFYHRVPVGHVEAGLRTYDKYSPYPEEMNRRMVSAIADLHFCPTPSNRDNLAREGIEQGVFLTGNTVIDALQTTVVKDFHFSEGVLNDLDYVNRKVILVTCHRRENYGTPMAHIMTALRRVATIESVGSSTRIDGSKLSDRHVETLLANLSIHTFTTRDEQEVAGYAETMEQVFQAWQHITLTENHIRQLHRDLLRHSDKDERHRGQYKHAPNSVAAFDAHGRQIGIVFETASPFDPPRLMQELVERTNTAFDARELHPLLIIGMFAVYFLGIHPFQDGNGRLSRILTTLLLLRCGYVYTPYS